MENVSKMKVTQLRIKNILGLEELEVSPGQINVIEGANGQGKSSTMNALMAAIGGGNLKEMRNINTDGKPEIVIHIEGENDYIVKRTASATSVKKRVGDSAAYEDVASPQRLLTALFDGKMANPIAFLDADPKNRVDIMLQAIDLPYCFDEMCEASGLDHEEFEAIPSGIHALVEIGLHRDNIFKTRTGVNRDLKQKAASADQLLRSVPAQIPGIGNVDKLRQSLNVMISEKNDIEKNAEKLLTDELERIATKLSSVIDKNDSEISKLKLEASERVREYEKKVFEQVEKDISTAKNYSNSASLAAQKSSQKARDEKEQLVNKSAAMQAEIDSKREELSTMEERQKQAIEFETIKSTAKDFQNEADTLEGQSKRLTGAIDAIDAYKAGMCSNLPIDGLEIDGKNITVDGVKWDQLNTAKQIEIAVAVAALRSEKQRLPIMFVDGAERLDSESLELLKAQIRKHKCQGFIAKVADKKLSIEEGE